MTNKCLQYVHTVAITAIMVCLILFVFYQWIAGGANWAAISLGAVVVSAGVVGAAIYISSRYAPTEIKGAGFLFKDNTHDNDVDADLIKNYEGNIKELRNHDINTLDIEDKNSLYADKIYEMKTKIDDMKDEGADKQEIAVAAADVNTLIQKRLIDNQASCKGDAACLKKVEKKYNLNHYR